MNKRKIFLIGAIMLGSLSFGMPLHGFEAEEKLSIDLKDAPIANVLRMISAQNDLNIILGQGISGEVTVHFTSVTVDEALRAIIEVNGFAYTRKGNIIHVTTLEDQERKPTSTYIFSLNNANASDVNNIVQGMLSPAGQVIADNRSNKLIIMDVPAVLDKLKDIIYELDSPAKQVMIEAKMIETTLDDDENLGIDWTLRASISGAARPHTFPFYTQDRGHSSSEFLLDAFPAAPTGLADGLFTFGTLDFSQMQAVLDILKRRGDTKILSNPKILTLDNQTATIHVGQTIPFPTYERNETTGNFEITGFEDSSDLGITLKVTPQITNDGYVIIQLNPSVRDIVGFTGPVDFQRPITSDRKASTRVKIKDGNTVVIGGLIKDTTIHINNKVPLLGNIPVLGYLFSHDTDQKDKTDLLIFVTVHIVPAEERVSDAFSGKAADNKLVLNADLGNISLRENHRFK